MVSVPGRDKATLAFASISEKLKPKKLLRNRLDSRKIYTTSAWFRPSLRNTKANVGIPSTQNKAVNMNWPKYGNKLEENDIMRCSREKTPVISGAGKLGGTFNLSATSGTHKQ
jgi:hypothetical protein